MVPVLGQHSVAQLIVFCVATVIVAICIFMVIDKAKDRRRRRG